MNASKLSVSAIISSVLVSCFDKEEETVDTGSDGQVLTVDHSYDCFWYDDQMCQYEESEITVPIDQFNAALGSDQQLSASACQQLCVDFDMSYDLCGCSVTGETTDGIGLTCVNSFCAMEGRGHGDISSADCVKAPDDVSRWAARAFHAEASSVGAFLQLRAELAKHGAPETFLERCLSAARDEVAHARAFARLCAKSESQVPPLSFGDVPLRSLEALALENAIEGCVNETYAALRAHVQAKRALQPGLRRMLRRIADDETRHAQLSHDLHDWFMSQLDNEAKNRVEQARIDALAKLPQMADLERNTPAFAFLGLPSSEIATCFIRLAA